MARLWSSGWELNSATDGVEWEGQVGSATVSSSVFYSGLYAGRLVDGGGSGTRWEKQITGSNVNGPWYIRSRIYIATIGTGASYSNGNIILTANSDSGTPTISIRLNTDGSLALWDSTVKIGSNSSVLSTNTWYRVEVYVFNNTGTGKLEATARIDGSDFATTTTSTNTGTLQFLRCGEMMGTAGTPTDIYYDDIAVNDTTDPGNGTQMSWPGDSKIVHIHPDGDGYNKQWQSQASGTQGTSTFGAIDEITPNDETDYNKRTTNSPTTTPIDDWTFGSSSDAGINSYDTINLISVGQRAGATSATATGRNVKLRIKSASGGSVQATGNIDISVNGWLTNNDGSPKVYQLNSYTDPTTGVAWTPTGTNSIDNMQCGYQAGTSSTNEIRITTLWALVDYTPGTPPASSSQSRFFNFFPLGH